MRHAAALALIAGLFVLPVVVLLFQAGAPGWRYPDIIPPDLSWDGLMQTMERPGPMLISLGSSVAYSLATVVMTVAMTLTPARFLAHASFRGKNLLEGLLLTPALVPAMTYSMGLHFVFIRLGLADNVVGVVLVLSIAAYPYMLRSLTTACAHLGRDYRTCALNLGASPARTFLQVELPLLLPALAAGGSVVFLVAFSEYFLVFLIGGGSVESFTGYLFPVITSSNRGLGALVTLIFLVVPVLLFAGLEMMLGGYFRRRGMR
jgi:putative spermidine/putrescine transport system permease protein